MIMNNAKLFYTVSDLQEIAKRCTGVLLLPFPIPMMPTANPYITSTAWNGWYATLRLCTINGEPSGGAIVTLMKDGVTLSNRIKSGRVCTHSIRNAFKRLAQMIMKLKRLVAHRAEAMQVCDNYLDSIQDKRVKRLATARLLKLARKAQRASNGPSRGLDSISYECMTPATCERLIDVVTFGQGYFLK